MEAKSFIASNPHEATAHVIAMVDERLPKIGLLGFFGADNETAGIDVLAQATQWLKDEHHVSVAYGPINGATSGSYRFNLLDDFMLPGEPVNPVFYIDIFKRAGFLTYNNYVTGISKHYQAFMKLHLLHRPPPSTPGLHVEPFNRDHPDATLKAYHGIMASVFPGNSDYAAKVSWREREFNTDKDSPIYTSEYCYYLYEKRKRIGLIIAYPYVDNLVIKTIAILPEYQHQNLSSILLKTVHDQAAKNGLSAAIYSTIKVGNAIYRMRQPGVNVYRRYITLQKQL